MNVTDIRNILEAPYNRTIWKDFIKTQFTNNNLLANDTPLNLGKNDLYKECYSLGSYAVDEFTKIGIFEVQLDDTVKLTRNRVGLRNLIKSITEQVAGAMVVFVLGDTWRFSYISTRYKKDKETGEVVKTETAPKRYTYLFGKNEKALTAALRFDKLIKKQQGNALQLLTLNDFEEAFSVEKLSKDFFNEYKKSYEDFVQYLTGKRYKKSGNKYVEQVVTEPNSQLSKLFDNNEKQARDFCKRMMGRIVFLYFIQKKGWLAVGQSNKWGEGNMDYLFDLFSKSTHQDNFYSNELVTLFFKTLNNPDSENASHPFRFPYLNGGLFDDTQDKKHNELQLPQNIFNTLFSTFNDYNFTVHEDAPDEHTVAVDPEMLGHIFENLLEDNKDKGAFYTPKEIVHYMCQQSLAEHIASKLDNADKTIIEKLIQQAELLPAEEKWAKQNATTIIDVLEKVRICDPAIGSGAFPMGLLLEIFNLMVVLHNYKGWGKKNEAEIKKHIIQESIYGVDIDAGAVDIARLRFWLSLVVDEEQPQPLPNLDFKIMQGNSLLGIPQNSVFNVSEVEKLEALKEEYFSINDPEKKKELKEHINNTNQNILDTANQYSSYKIDFDFKLFFSEVYHGKDSGFDILIGNPPYVQLQKMGKEADNLAKADYKTFARTGDIYCLFYEIGFRLLKSNGILTFITSNKWMRAAYGEVLRKYFITNTNPLMLIDFGGFQVFESATVDTNIFIGQKSVFQNKVNTCVLGKGFSLDNMSDYFRQNTTVSTNFSAANSWVVLDETEKKIKEKIERIGIPLKHWDVKINYGIKTGFNDAFIISSEKRDELILKCPKADTIIRPILLGRNIKRYNYSWDNYWVILSGFGAYKNLEIKYPAVYEHLLSYEDKLRKRGQCRYTSSGKVNTLKDYPGQHHWSELDNNPSEEFLASFNKPKIAWGNMALTAQFTFVEGGMCINAPAVFISTDNLYLLAIMNSKLGDYYIKQLGVSRNGGYVEYKPMFVEKLPIPEISKEKQLPFINLVKSILKNQEKGIATSSIESKMDEMVFELYELTDSEISIITGSL